MGPFLLSDKAYGLFSEYVNEHSAIVVSYAGAMNSAAAKLEGGAARLACLRHILDAVTEEGFPSAHVSGSAMERGIELARFFLHEAARLYGMLTQNDQDAELEDLLHDLHDLGPCTVRDLQRRRRRWKEQSAAEVDGKLRRLAGSALARSWTESTDGASAVCFAALKSE